MMNKKGIIMALVFLLAVGLSGCTEETTTPQESQEQPPQNMRPVAIIQVDKIEGDAPLTVTFDASKSYDPDGEIMNYTWLFPIELDKRQSVENSTRYGMIVTHTFFEPGKKLVELRVIEKEGYYDAWAEIEITVNE